MQSQEWIDDFQRRVDEMREKSERLQETLAATSATETSSDGLISVTVGPNGALQGLTIDDRALTQRGAELTAAIMQTFGKAQARAAHEVAGALEPLAGGSEMMRVVQSFLPPPPEDEEAPEPGEEPAEPPAPPPPAAVPRPSSPSGQPGAPRPPRAHADDEDVDFDPW